MYKKYHVIRKVIAGSIVVGIASVVIGNYTESERNRETSRTYLTHSINSGIVETTSKVSSKALLEVEGIEISVEEDIVEEVGATEPEIEVVDSDYTRYATWSLNIREFPTMDSDVVGGYSYGDEVHVTGEVLDSEFVRVSLDGEDAFVHSDYLSEEKPKVQETKKVSSPTYSYSGQQLTRQAGTIQGPSGKETYYNLNMSGVVSIMRFNGYSYEYWVRDDGVKMFGPYIMIAADLSIRPRGSLVPTSLGMGMVCDTGTFIYSNPTQIDIATTW